jgi:cytochrome oxidase Cu insertion factor (SCO1/SenC/PrrC family)
MFSVPRRWYYRAATGTQRRATRQTLRRTIRMRKGIGILVLGMLALAAPRTGNHLWAQTEKNDTMPDPAVKVGDMAPDFTLMDTHRNQVSLHDFRGKKNVALAFYIFAFTGG